jgi:hypothetical protein
MKPCDVCCSTGFRLGLPIYHNVDVTGSGLVCESVKCKKCDGKGYYDPDELISVSIKAVKPEYFKGEVV